MNNLLSFFKSHWLLVVILLLLTGFSSLFLFNSIYVTFGIIIAPYKTGSLVFFYLSVFFLVTMFFGLVSKLCSIIWTVKKSTDEENHPSYADITSAVALTILFLIATVFYLAFYYKMSTTVEPYTSSAGVMSSFGSLFPSIFAVIVGFLEKRLINLLSDLYSTDNSNSSTANQQNVSTNSDQIKAE